TVRILLDGEIRTHLSLLDLLLWRAKDAPRFVKRAGMSFCKCFALIVIVLLLSLTMFLPGCSTLASIRDTPDVHTEQARQWLRKDKGRRDLVVFVHGFLSSIDSAWGDFPTLVKDDPEFASFNVFLFGYPTKHCGQVADIARSGELLSSYLKGDASAY